jgi:nitrogen-specific signal transduction histidine kinase
LHCSKYNRIEGVEREEMRTKRQELIERASKIHEELIYFNNKGYVNHCYYHKECTFVENARRDERERNLKAINSLESFILSNFLMPDSKVFDMTYQEIKDHFQLCKNTINEIKNPFEGVKGAKQTFKEYKECKKKMPELFKELSQS